MESWFDHRHYVPVLKGKRGEFAALGQLKNQDGLTPLMESIPTKPASEVPAGMSKVWPADKPYFLDCLFLDDEDMGEDEADDHLINECFKEVDNQGQIAVPVTSTSRSPAYQAAVASIVKNHGFGFAIRLVPEDFDDEDELEKALDALLKYMNLGRDEVDLLVDYGSVETISPGTLAQLHRVNIGMLPHLHDWRSVTVIAGAFPTGLAPLTRSVWNSHRRNDWLAWYRLMTKKPKPARLPTYGDYAIAHPDLPPTGRATILAQLRYSIANVFMIWKGYNVFTHPDGFDQFLDICADLVGRPEFCGAAFSWGDGEIHAKATTGGSPGNAETWRKIGTNHHLEMVMDQIANLP